MRRAIPAVTTVLLSLAIALAVPLGTFALAAVLFALVVVLASGWPTLLGLPTPRGSTTVLALAGAVAVLVVAFTMGSQVDPLHQLSPVLACSIVVAFLHQLLRRDMRPRLIDSVTGVLAGVIVIESSAAWLPTAAAEQGVALGALGALIGAAIVLAVVDGRRLRLVLTVLAAVLLASVVAVLSQAPLLPVVAAGVAAATLTAAFDLIFKRLPSSNSMQAGLAVGAASVCATGFVAFLAQTWLT